MSYGGQARACGRVFKLTPGGLLTTLHDFAGYPMESSKPEGRLIQAADGNLYGTTEYGGANNCNEGVGCGTVFKISLAGTLTMLHSFDLTDGYQPYAGVVQATDGNFYGTTGSGGTGNSGTVFRITSSGTLTTLYNFAGADGAGPGGPLVQATDGNFYGTTQSGGTDNDGTVFKITSGGALTTLHSFDITDGSQPYGGVVQDTNGTFYGTTHYDGTVGDGTVFSWPWALVHS